MDFRAQVNRVLIWRDRPWSDLEIVNVELAAQIARCFMVASDV